MGKEWGFHSGFPSSILISNLNFHSCSFVNCWLMIIHCAGKLMRFSNENKFISSLWILEWWQNFLPCLRKLGGWGLNFNISVSSILLLIKNFMKRIHKMKIDARLLFSKWPDLATLLQISLWYSLWSPCWRTDLQFCLEIFTLLLK